MIVKFWWRLVRFGFRLLYNEMAFTYDLVSWLVSFGQWRRWQRAALHELLAGPDARVLELAHGTGNLHLDLRARGFHVVSLDLSPYMGCIARRKLRRHGLRLRLVRADAAALPFGGAAFSAVVTTFPTPFILQPETLADVARVLRPGGRLVVGATGRITGAGPLARLLELAYRVTGQRGELSIEPILDRFRAAGLEPTFTAREVAGGEVWLVVADKPL